MEELRAKQLVIAVHDLEAAHKLLAKYEGLSIQDGRIAIKDPRAVKAPEMIATILVNAGTPPTHLAVEQENLEEYFLRLTK